MTVVAMFIQRSGTLLSLLLLFCAAAFPVSADNGESGDDAPGDVLETARLYLGPLEVRDGDDDGERASGLSEELQTELRSRLERYGLSVGDEPDTAAGVLEASTYLILASGRIGFGINIYDRDTGYLVAGDFAVASSERGILSALDRSVETVVEGARTYLERRAAEDAQRVDRIVVRSPQPNVSLYLPDGTLFGTTGEELRLEIADPPFRRGQRLSLELHRPRYYSRRHTLELTEREQETRLPRLPARTRMSGALRYFPALPAGGGFAFRFYPLPDQFFAETAGALMRLDDTRGLQSELEFARANRDDDIEWNDFEVDGDVTFVMSDISLNAGAYLFVRPGRFVRPGVQTGVGVWSAATDDWSSSTLYVAPANPFVSFGRGRVRGRLVTSIRYTLDPDGPFGQRVHGGNDNFLYAWLEVGYTW